MRRIICFAVLCAFLCAVVTAGADQHYTKTVRFLANHQNPWGYKAGSNGTETDVGSLDYIRSSMDLLKPLAGNFGIQTDGTIDHDFDLIGIFVSVPLIGLDTGAGITLHIDDAAIGFEFESIASGGKSHWSIRAPSSCTIRIPRLRFRVITSLSPRNGFRTRAAAR